MFLEIGNLGGGRVYPESYIRYLIELHLTRDWFECHEIMEEAWKEEQDPELKLLWLSLIRLAVGLYHERRANPKGALTMYERVLEAMPNLAWQRLKIEPIQLTGLVEERIKAVQHNHHAQAAPPYDLYLELPLCDHRLIEACVEHASLLGLDWHDREWQHDEAIIHRHSQRDRTDVIEAREASLAKKEALRRSPPDSLEM
nr:DUF309 domain-containing protein [Paenibacillus aquistagni]